MDRKMDSGFLEGDETMEDNYDIEQELTPAEVVGIMDQLLLHEVSFNLVDSYVSGFILPFSGCMAYGTSTVPDNLYLPVYRQHTPQGTF